MTEPKLFKASGPVEDEDAVRKLVTLLMAMLGSEDYSDISVVVSAISTEVGDD